MASVPEEQQWIGWAGLVTDGEDASLSISFLSCDSRTASLEALIRSTADDRQPAGASDE